MIKFPKTPRLQKTLQEDGIHRNWRKLNTVVQEKVDGCVTYQTNITMSDGSRRRIGEITVGDEVLGVDSEGTVVSTPVIRVFNNGHSSDGWLNVKGERRGAGRGSSYFSITCTPNHRFWVDGRYVRADELCIGDMLTLHRSEMGLTPIQDQVILGKLLGDGSLSMTKWSAHLAWNHSKKDAKYSKWTARALGDLFSKHSDGLSGYGSEMVRGRTSNSAHIKRKFESFIVNSKKTVPEWVAYELTPLSLAFWFMDDGNISHSEGQEDRVRISTCAFSNDDIDVFLRGLRKLGVGAKGSVYRGYNYIDILSDDAERLFLLIAPYVPECMQRKLPERYRGHDGWLPRQNSVYKPVLVKQTVLSVGVCEKPRSCRYDIETGTHNYFAGGVLVHNSNTAISFDDDTNLLLQSRGHYLRGGPRERQFDLFKQWANQNLDDLFDMLSNRFILFGEWCYAKHHIFYDNLPAYFLGFDVYDKSKNRFVSTKRYHNIVDPEIVHSVPTLHESWFSKFNNFGQFIQPTSLKTKEWRTKLVEIAGEKELDHTDPSDLMEGIYVRIEDEDWTVGRMKLPREEFMKVRTDDSHWMTRPIIPNLLGV